ncbi:hypothetical protein ACO0RG_002106 [Hanseniaspora osmophila]|uniref:DNA-(apurinic or apyrimidinic site) lyase n=1 Tax=Hanseniaspora osmophila TaxID=56408 RepID=A0A1E5RH54_9ASCO|nr:N-glycosylase/DNA lyase [Hanseniaspora osmophila]
MALTENDIGTVQICCFLIKRTSPKLTASLQDTEIKMTALEWLKVPCKKDFLDISIILQIGQSFRWIYNPLTQEYLSSVNLKRSDCFAVVKLKQDEHHIYYQLCPSLKKEESQDGVLALNSQVQDLAQWVHNYFRLSLKREALFEHWAKVDLKNAESFYKLRSSCCVLHQDPWETLISFICSSNNNISRITKMCHKLTELAGTPLGYTENGVDLHAFPTSTQMISCLSEASLRKWGFGYRSKYIIDTAKLIQEFKEADKESFKSDSQYLYDKLHGIPYLEAREFLLHFPGVGPKVADCVLLMGGFGFDEVVPVDVHVKRIAERDYRFGSKKQTKARLEELKLEYVKYKNTKKKINYDLDAIRLQLIDLWGPHAGWAQALLFTKEVGSTSGKVGDAITKRKIDIAQEPTSKRSKA